MLQVLAGTQSIASDVRENAEASLARFESNATPGYLGTLVSIASQRDNVVEVRSGFLRPTTGSIVPKSLVRSLAHPAPPRHRPHVQDIRLMALIVAKNVVGSSWTKQIKSREWKKFPEDEKSAVRNILLADILAKEASERICTHASLMIANIAQFDYPDKWPTLLEDLLQMGLPAGGLPLERRHRPLKAIKYVSKMLEKKRFILEEPGGAPLMTLAPSRLQELGSIVEAARLQMRTSLRALLVPLAGIWEAEFDAQNRATCHQDRLHRMKICRVAVSACACAMWTVDSVEPDRGNDLNDMRGAEAPSEMDTGPTTSAANGAGNISEVGRVLANSCSLATRVAEAVFQTPESGGVQGGSDDAMSKLWERLIVIGVVGVTKHTTTFAANASAWLDLVVRYGIMAVDAKVAHTLRTKTRVLPIRLLARMLLHPHFRRSYLHARQSQLPDPMLAFKRGRGPPGSGDVDDPAIRHAIACLEDLLSLDNGKCDALVEAVASRYILMTPEERLEWETDPEGFAREVDLETSPDADTPRPCGIGLVECMLEHSPDNVRRSIMSLAQRVAQNPATSDEAVMAREAVYRIIGECFPHLKDVISFDQWYSNELKGIIAGTDAGVAGMSALSRSVLTSRCLWLVGVCSEEMSIMPFVEALGLCTSRIKDQDLVVSLMAVSAVGAMVTQVIEEQAFTLQPQRTRFLLLEGSSHISEEEDNIVKQAELEFKMHLDAVLANLDPMVANCFGLLPNLVEVESMVRVVQCVTSAVELVGEKISGHFESFTRCIPPLWNMINDASLSGRQDRAALVRLQCSILAMLGHLISKLGRAAVSSPAISQVVYPLLLSSTDPANAAAEPLAEDALRLWLSMLHSSPDLTTDLVELGPARLVPHLERGKEPDFCLRIAAAYALHGGLDSVTHMLDLVADRIDRVVISVIQSLKGRPETQERVPPSALQSITLIPPQSAKELDAALALLGILQRLYGELPAPLEGPIKSVCALLCLDFRRGARTSSNASFVPGRLAHLLHPALQIIARLLYSSPSAIGPLTDFDRNSQVRLLDRWVILGSSQDVGEVFVPQISALGRSRRHNLAVSMCAMIISDECELLRDGPRVARCLIVCLKAALEQIVFEKEQEMLFSDSSGHVGAAQGSSNDDSHPQDFLREKRLLMKRADPLRTVDAMDALRQAANHVMGYLGREGLLSLLETYNPVFSAEMAKIVSSTLSEADTEAALRALENAHL